MKPEEQRNERLAARVIEQLAARHMQGCYCATAVQAVDWVMSIMKPGSTVSWGGSMTLRDMGLTAAIHASGQYTVLDRDRAKTPETAEKMYRRAFAADYYLTSANAVSYDGQIVNIDGRGNRVAAINFGPKQVIFVVGMNKLVPTVEGAVSRVRRMVAPINAARLGLDTPCTSVGDCCDCLSPRCICNSLHVLRNSFPANRHSVVLVGESLGY